MTASAIVVIVSDRCRSPEPSICGDTATANSRIAMFEPTTRKVASLERSTASWVIAVASEPYGMFTRL
jgi:hypothetical protein